MAAILYDHTARNQNVRANILVPKRKFLRAAGRIVHVECPFRRVDTGFGACRRPWAGSNRCQSGEIN